MQGGQSPGNQGIQRKVRGKVCDEKVMQKDGKNEIVLQNSQKMLTLHRDVATLGGAGRLRPALEPTTRHSERFKVFCPALIMVN